MSNQLIVKAEIEINASLDKVWDVLTQTKYYRQWDELPENFTNERLSKGDVLEWEGHAKMTVVQCEANRYLKMSLFLPKLELDLSEYDITYSYSLSNENAKTILSFEIGDFSPLPDAVNYYEETIKFVKTAKEKIKGLSENN